MTSPTCVKISKFWWNGFKIEYWTSKYLFLFLNIFQSTLVNEISIWTFLTHFWVGNVATGVKISKFGASSFKNEYFISNFPLYWLHLYITMDTWYTNVGHFWLIFWLMNSPRESRLAKFWGNDLRNKLFISNFHQYLFPSSYHLRYMI